MPGGAAIQIMCQFECGSRLLRSGQAQSQPWGKAHAPGLKPITPAPLFGGLKPALPPKAKADAFPEQHTGTRKTALRPNSVVARDDDLSLRGVRAAAGTPVRLVPGFPVPTTGTQNARRPPALRLNLRQKQVPRRPRSGLCRDDNSVTRG